DCSDHGSCKLKRLSTNDNSCTYLLPLFLKRNQNHFCEPKWKTFDGRKEIWDALKAAAVAIECNDHELAQAIVDGASITLPLGSLMECYDELGNRYQLPAYCLAPPVNLVSKCNDHNVSENSELQEKKEKEFQLKVRLSSGKDLRLSATMADSIRQLKKQLQIQEDIDTAHQRWFFSGKLLTDKTHLQDTKIQKDFVIQVIVTQTFLPEMSTFSNL
uniref:Ubiquitin domain-containing protein 1-like n=1 Tax=Sinocyclocheilus anshuiensis TaxID=1608454 RepID=A0A671R9V3_9TELE